MTIVIDTNSLSCVFSLDDDKHNEFKPIKDWVLGPNGSIAYGGTKYMSELNRAERYLRLIVELSNMRKAEKFDSSIVDAQERRIKDAINDSDFDDPHIIALTIVSKSRVICTLDKRSHKYIKCKSLYPKGHKRPKIYGGLHNKDLINSL